MSQLTSHMSHVLSHVSCVTCQVSSVKCNNPICEIIPGFDNNYKEVRAAVLVTNMTANFLTLGWHVEWGVVHFLNIH